MPEQKPIINGELLKQQAEHVLGYSMSIERAQAAALVLAAIEGEMTALRSMSLDRLEPASEFHPRDL